MIGDEWSDARHVEHYMARTGEFGAAEGERMLLGMLAPGAGRILDLGTGDGRVIAAATERCPDARCLGVDRSPLMLAKARERFAGEPRVELLEHDLGEPLPALGRFDAIVSSMAIHHLPHDRKRTLYAECFALLRPGGVLANFEHVASPSERLHRAFFEAIEEPPEFEDRSDRLLDVESQLQMLRTCGFEDVDCHWKWLELALLAGIRPGG
jgi:SAM-dependent methyltransferase